MFIKYCHIENLYQADKLLEKVRREGLDSQDYAYGCFRKIDGCNVQLSVGADGTFSAASRNQEIPLGEGSPSFNGLEKVIKRCTLDEKVKLMKEKFAEIMGIKSLDFSFTVFGELYGGLYRHPDVPRDKEAARIQGRIDYSPSNHWMAFDAVASSPDWEGPVWLSTNELEFLCHACGVQAQIEDFTGTLDECLAFSPEFIDDTGHVLFGLPLVENNFAEGVVIKPHEYLEVGPLHERVIFKNKNPKYKERIRATKEKTKEAGAKLQPLEQEWLEKMCEFMNSARAMSAKSKLGSGASFSEIIEEATKDALQEFQETYGEEFSRVQRENDPKDFSEKKITKAFAKFSIPFAREAYLGK